MTVSAIDRDLLIRTVIGEAQGEGEEGMAAVTHVVLNRVKAGSFGGRSVREVVLAPNQFEPWQTRRAALLSISRDSPVYLRAAQIVDRVLSGARRDPTGGATHFLNVDLVRRRGDEVPAWAYRLASSGPVQKIGAHTFLGGSERLAQADTGTKTDAGPSERSRERARMLLGGGDTGAPEAPSATAPGPRKESVDRARRLLGLDEAPKRRRKDEMAELRRMGPAKAATGALDILTDTATFGFGDELQAAAFAAVEPFAGLDASGQPAPEGEGFGERYRRNLETVQGDRQAFREAVPRTARAVDLAGLGISAVAGGLAAGPLSRTATRAGIPEATSMFGRAGRAAGAGSVAGGLAGAGYSEGGLTQRLMGAAGGAALGGGLGLIASPAIELVQRILSPLIRRGRAFVRGQLTDEARAALREAGLDPDQVARELAEAFEARARKLGTTKATARRVAADEFGIPLSRGQATGSFDDIAFEEAAKAGSRGQGAGQVARTFEDQQRRAIREAGEAMVPGARTAAEAGETVRGGLVGARAGARAGVKAAYDAVPKGTVIDVRAFPQLMDDAAAALDDVTFNPSAHARAALAEIDKLTKKTRTVRIRPTGETGVSVPGDTTGDAAEVVGVDFRAVEGLRKRLNAVSRRISRSDAQAAYEVDTIRKAMDDWLDRSVAEALIAGDDAALELVKAARVQYATYRKMFTAQGAGDDAGKMLEIMTDPRIRPDGLTPQETVRYLFGASRVGAAGHSVRMARRIKRILGDGSEEWQALRQGAWQRIITPREGQEIGAQALASRVLDFTKGDGAALARELFSADEIAKMNRFANVLRMTVPPKRATNPSGTAAALARTVQDAFNQVTTTVGAVTSPVQTFGAKLLRGILTSRGGKARALAAFDPAGRLPVSPRAGFGGSFAAGLGAGQATGEFVSP